MNRKVLGKIGVLQLPPPTHSRSRHAGAVLHTASRTSHLAPYAFSTLTRHSFQHHTSSRFALASNPQCLLLLLPILAASCEHPPSQLPPSHTFRLTPRLTHCSSQLTNLHTSHIAPHTSHLAPPSSHLTHSSPFSSHLTSHTSQLTYSALFCRCLCLPPPVCPPPSHFPHTCHLTAHLSHHTSHLAPPPPPYIPSPAALQSAPCPPSPAHRNPLPLCVQVQGEAHGVDRRRHWPNAAVRPTTQKCPPPPPPLDGEVDDKVSWRAAAAPESAASQLPQVTLIFHCLSLRRARARPAGEHHPLPAPPSLLLHTRACTEHCPPRLLSAALSPFAASSRWRSIPGACFPAGAAAAVLLLPPPPPLLTLQSGHQRAPSQSPARSHTCFVACFVHGVT